MKKIEAIIKPFDLEDVQKALGEIGVEEMTVTEVHDIGLPARRTEVFRGSEYTLESESMTKLDLVIEDAAVDNVVDAIFKSTTDRHLAEGKVFISTVEKAVKIATSEVSR